MDIIKLSIAAIGHHLHSHGGEHLPVSRQQDGVAHPLHAAHDVLVDQATTRYLYMLVRPDVHDVINNNCRECGIIVVNPQCNTD